MMGACKTVGSHFRSLYDKYHGMLGSIFEGPGFMETTKHMLVLGRVVLVQSQPQSLHEVKKVTQRGQSGLGCRV